MSTRQIREWVKDLRAHTEEAKQEEDGAPKKKAHREEARQYNKEKESNPFVSGGVNEWQSLSIHTWLH